MEMITGLAPAFFTAWGLLLGYVALAAWLTRAVIAHKGGWGCVQRKGWLAGAALFMPLIFLAALIASAPAILQRTRRFARQLRKER